MGVGKAQAKILCALVYEAVRALKTYIGLLPSTIVTFGLMDGLGGCWSPIALCSIFRSAVPMLRSVYSDLYTASIKCLSVLLVRPCLCVLMFKKNVYISFSAV